MAYIAFDPSVASAMSAAALGSDATILVRPTDRSAVVESFEAD